MTRELKPCPFCGGEGKLKVADGILDDFTMFYCYCPNGKRIAGGTDWFRSREEAIEAWNTRAERTCRYEHTDHCTRVCTSCGREVETFHLGYNYCPRCGAYIETDEENAMFRKVVRP